MIQRIQSLYLLLAMIILSTLFFFPVASFNLRGAEVMMEITGFAGDFEFTQITYWFPLLVVVNAVLILMLAFIIISFKDRKRQLKWCNLALLINVLFLIFLFFGMDLLSKKLEPDSVQAGNIVRYLWPTYMPVLSLLMILLAMRGVKNDEKRVRSSDRLR
ncbi:MAG: DUF4293 domain-containing protein [Bacteroidales bacterium]